MVDRKSNPWTVPKMEALSQLVSCGKYFAYRKTQLVFILFYSKSCPELPGLSEQDQVCERKWSQDPFIALASEVALCSGFPLL